MVAILFGGPIGGLVACVFLIPSALGALMTPGHQLMGLILLALAF